MIDLDPDVLKENPRESYLDSKITKNAENRDDPLQWGSTQMRP